MPEHYGSDSGNPWEGGLEAALWYKIHQWKFCKFICDKSWNVRTAIWSSNWFWFSTCCEINKCNFIGLKFVLMTQVTNNITVTCENDGRQKSSEYKHWFLLWCQCSFLFINDISDLYKPIESSSSILFRRFLYILFGKHKYDHMFGVS